MRAEVRVNLGRCLAHPVWMIAVPHRAGQARIECADVDQGQQAGQDPLDLGPAGSGHRRVDELAVDEPELDAGIAPAATE
jgi:hypothetical protein